MKMTSQEKTFNLVAYGTNEIDLPTCVINRACSIGVDYLHVEFEKPTSNEYIKLVSNSAANGKNPEGIIYRFFQPARMKNIVEQPANVRYFDFRKNYNEETIKLVTEKENKIKRMALRIHAEIFES